MRRHRLLLPQLVALGLLATAACAPKTLVVLAKYPDHPLGGATVSNAAGSTDLGAENQATTIGSATSAPSRPAPIDKATLTRIFGASLAALPAPPRHFVLNFGFDSAALSPESEARLPEIVAAVRDLGSEVVSVVGHTDASGDREYNLKLSQQRADTVKSRLVALGVAEGTIEVAFHGAAVPLVQSGDNAKDERNRRVEVVVR
jgi:outer membrane protein OmpA-like peptidoglycan-associated protein